MHRLNGIASLVVRARAQRNQVRFARRLSSSGSGGFTLIEVLVVMAILAISLSLFGSTLGASLRLDPVGREKAIAAEAARSKLEEMRNHVFAQVFVLYNDDPTDDPGGAGTAPGSCFSVQDLTAPSAGACVGRVTFPTIGKELREDVVDESLGMPRDLNGDDAVDSASHAGDCILLPIRVTLEWMPESGKGGKRNLTLYTMFSAL